MILVLRFFFIIIYFFLICFFGCIYCMFLPRNTKNVALFCRLFGYIIIILGLNIEIRESLKSKKCNHAIYIANHQSYYDILVASKVIKSNTVTIGKKSLLFVPLFGLLYWLSGNFTINRNNPIIARKKIKKIIKTIKKKKFLFGFFLKEQEV